jgi:xanthine dehydrogenase iron-sulfur cluster and FAD-binding subunit A
MKPTTHGQAPPARKGFRVTYPFYIAPTSLADALAAKAHYGAAARIIAGATDLLLEIERGVRKTPAGGVPGVIDLTRIPGLAEIDEQGGMIHLGPLVTHNQCVASPLIVDKAFPLARACWEVGAPQIRNRATIAGNIITASPANDAIAPLLALGAVVTLTSAGRGERTLPLAAFVTGFRKVDMADDEILTLISFPAMQPNQAGIFIKLGLRRAQAISVVNAAVIVGRDAAGTVTRAAISLGSVAATVVRATAAEAFLVGKLLDAAAIEQAAALALEAATPIDDIRSSADYRRGMVRTLVMRGLRQIAAGDERAGWPARPVLLWGESDGKWPTASPSNLQPGEALVNGRAVCLPGGMTLLDSLRAAGFVGVKEGCAEGECGACTVIMDGMAVMACMAPAERAAGSAIVTVEGLQTAEQLHPVQAAFVAAGGVQCGYCTPGFIVSAANLLQERPHPTIGEAQEALTGNFCRCTGYRKILDAVVQAGQVQPKEPVNQP